MRGMHFAFLRTEVSCSAHTAQQSAVFGIPELVARDLSQVLRVCSQPREKLAVLYAFSNK